MRAEDINMYVEMKNINKSFGNFQAAKDINFGVEKGSLTALLGPSGSGKTTILRMIAGLELQDSGDVIIEDRVVNDIPAGERGIGFVFQNYALFRYMTVYDNIAFGLKVKKFPKEKIKDRVSELTELVGLSGMEKRYPGELSGGQRQRVAFARALAPSPQLLLLDEPFAAIDAKVRKELRTWLKQMIAHVGITSIFVTHDQEEAATVSDRIIVINEGRVEQAGSPVKIYQNPETPFVAGFIGTSAVVNNLCCFKGFEDVPEGSSAIIRPEFCEAFKSGSAKFGHLEDAAERGVITDTAFMGSALLLTCDVNGNALSMNRSLERRPVAAGDNVYVLVYRAYVKEGNGIKIYENSLLKDADTEGL